VSVEIGVVLAPQVGGGGEQALAWARQAEDAGLDSVWVADHVLGFPPPQGILEAWTLMAAVAGATSRVGVGAQVLCQSFRNPALLAKMATTLDLVAAGRLRFLVGAGWFQLEYKAFGWPFPQPRDRLAELEETVRICRGMFDAGDQPFSFEGARHSVREAWNTPPPARRIPIGVGGSGDRLLDLIAREADEWNCPAQALPRLDDRLARLDQRLAAHGRQVRRSLQVAFYPDEDVPSMLRFFHPRLGLVGARDRILGRAGELARLGFTGLCCMVGDERGLAALCDLAPSLRELTETASAT
jgi:alkanesulfonate monooxygenase SsuD/methylene tetrahydromethanopterin reductase-like flavin-dependent oxidoreductase (luciferase family)